jgi:hypothetical protein
MDTIQPGEAHALEPAFAELAVGRIGGSRGHWREEGVLPLYPGLTIVNGAGEGWEDKLSAIPCVQATRLDADHIAVIVER